MAVEPPERVVERGDAARDGLNDGLGGGRRLAERIQDLGDAAMPVVILGPQPGELLPIAQIHARAV